MSQINLIFSLKMKINSRKTGFASFSETIPALADIPRYLYTKFNGSFIGLQSRFKLKGKNSWKEAVAKNNNQVWVWKLHRYHTNWVRYRPFSNMWCISLFYSRFISHGKQQLWREHQHGENLPMTSSHHDIIQTLKKIIHCRQEL